MSADQNDVSPKVTTALVEAVGTVLAGLWQTSASTTSPDVKVDVHWTVRFKVGGCLPP